MEGRGHQDPVRPQVRKLMQIAQVPHAAAGDEIQLRESGPRRFQQRPVGPPSGAHPVQGQEDDVGPAAVPQARQQRQGRHGPQLRAARQDPPLLHVEAKDQAPGGDGGPDGIDFDEAGNLLATNIGASAIEVYAPDGSWLQSIETPFARPSNVHFGGPDGRWVYVTEHTNNALWKFHWIRRGQPQYCQR